MSALESCSLCLREVNEQDKLLPCSKLYKVCLKYLHSSFTDELLSRPSNKYILPICPKCWESAMQLFDLSEQIKAFQKRISEFIFIFSLGILHRRGKIAEVDYCTKSNNFNERKSPEVDVPVSTNYAFGIDSSVIGNVPLTALSPEIKQEAEMSCDNNYASEETVSENNYAIKGTIYQNNHESEFNDPLQSSSQLPENGKKFEVIFEGIKCESNPQKSGNEDIGVEVNEDSNHEFSGGKIDIKGISISTALMVVDKNNPILKIQKLQFQSNGHKIIATANEVHDTSNQHKINSTTVWNKSDAGGSYKVCEKSKTRHNNCAPSMSTQNLTVSTNVTTSKPATTLISEETIPIIMLERKTTKTGSENFVRRKNNEYKKQLKIKLVQCNVCGKIQSSKANLAIHMSIHTGKLPYKCNFCNRRFRLKGSMEVHRRTHTGKMPFKCSFCLKSFTHSGLKSHHRMHHRKEKPFKCPTCGKEFVLKSDLTRHIVTHSAEKAFHCDQCQFTTYHKFNLTKHKLKLHQYLGHLNWFKCRECDMSFKSPDLVKGHYECVHFALDFSDECVIKCN